MTARYRFELAWSVPLRRDAVFEVLADVAAYPDWWPQVRAVARVDDDTARVVVRSVLPYSLDLTLVRVVQDPAAGVLEARVRGRLDGWSRWTMSGRGTSTWLLYEQEVTARGRLLEVGSRVARPLLVANHDAMMRGARDGLLAVAGQPRSTAGRW